MNAATPPLRCASATTWSASEVLPLLSGPNPRVQMAVAELVVQKDLPDRVALLTPLLGAEDPALRRIAMREVAKGSALRTPFAGCATRNPINGGRFVTS